MKIDPTWRGKTFDSESGTGFNRLSPLAMYTLRAVAPLYGGMRRAGAEVTGFAFDHCIDTAGMLQRDHGHIVNVASMAAKVTTPGISVYCATKYAVAALSRAVRAEIASSSVTVSTVMPTAVHTELTAGVALDLLPTRQPADIASAIADSARHPRREIAVPRWLAPIGTLEEATPEPLLQFLKHIATLRRPLGHYDRHARRRYLNRIGQ